MSHAVATHPEGGQAERMAIKVEYGLAGSGLPSNVCLLPSNSNLYIPSANGDAAADPGVTNATADPTVAVTTAMRTREMIIVNPFRLP